MNVSTLLPVVITAAAVTDAYKLDKARGIKMSKLSMPKLKESAKIGASVAGYTALNFVIAKQVATELQKGNRTPAIMFAGGAALTPFLAALTSKKYPIVSAAVGGASAAITITGLLAYLTQDITMVASNPKMARELAQLAQGSELSGLPENILFLATGK